jgi:hypothetical protein
MLRFSASLANLLLARLNGGIVGDCRGKKSKKPGYSFFSISILMTLFRVN